MRGVAFLQLQEIIPYLRFLRWHYKLQVTWHLPTSLNIISFYYSVFDQHSSPYISILRRNWGSLLIKLLQTLKTYQLLSLEMFANISCICKKYPTLYRYMQFRNFYCKLLTKKKRMHRPLTVKAFHVLFCGQWKALISFLGTFIGL